MKISLTKCEDIHNMNNRNKLDNSSQLITSSTTNSLSFKANIVNANYVESDSEYETEEVYELREWYPPDFWKSSTFNDVDNANNSTQNIKNLNYLNKKSDKDQICLTDVTVNDLTVTMFESHSDQGLFKTL